MEDAGLNPISPPPPASPMRRGRRTSGEGAKVVIPLSDTPIIQRNKQFRKEAGGGGSNSRRSSLGLRGRRASSLIDSGQIGTLESCFVGTRGLRVKAGPDERVNRSAVRPLMTRKLRRPGGILLDYIDNRKLTRIL